MQPTLKSILFMVTGIPLSLAVIQIDQQWWWGGLVYLAAVFLVLLFDGISAPGLRSLEPDVETPAMAFIGDSEQLVLSIGGSNRETVTVDVLCDLGGDVSPAPEKRVTLSPGKRKRVAFDLTARRRGTIVVERIWLRWRGRLGFALRSAAVNVGKSVPVVPNVRAVRRNAVRFFSRDAFFGMKTQNQQGDGSEFSALREYVPGLDHRSIDWKHSARHNALVCKEFETERNHQIIVAFDTGHLMSEPVDGIPRLDHAINAGLLIAFVSLRHGDRVGFFCFDETVRGYAEPVSGARGFQLLQRLSADYEYRLGETNFTLGLADLTGRLNRRSLIIVLTDFVDTTTAELMIESVGRLTKRHLVLFVSIRDLSLHALVDAEPGSSEDIARAVIADDILKERQTVFEKIRRLGAHCLEAPGEMIGVDLVNSYMAIKRRELI